MVLRQGDIGVSEHRAIVIEKGALALGIRPLRPVATPQGVIRTTPETIPRISISSCRRYSGSIGGV